MKFTSLTFIFIGVCIAAQYYGQRIGVEKTVQSNFSSTGISSHHSPNLVFEELDEIDQNKNPVEARADEISGSSEVAHKLVTRSVQAGEIWISEVQSSNAGEVVDEEGLCPDWVELWNPSTFSFELTGWFLTDELAKPRKWKFPELVVPAGARIVVYASGRDVRDASQLETNFRLGQKDQYVALVKPDARTIAQILPFENNFAKQGVSFGLADRGAVSLPLQYPTPGEKNAESGTGVVERVRFLTSSRLFQSSFQLELECRTTEATIRYTTDGSIPTVESGAIYTKPLKIDRTTIVRAIAVAPKMISSEQVTRTYLSVDSLIKQPNRITGFPKNWNETESDYAMDPRISSQYEAGVRSALESLPMVSVVTDPESLWGENGIYSNTWERGFNWEVPAAIEMFDFEGQSGFSATAGIRVSGNESRKAAWKKHSLRLNFRARYGGSVLNTRIFEQSGNDQFSTLVLRSTDDSWVTHDAEVRNNAQFIRDQWARDTHRAMGEVSARGRFVHVSINGLYWGVYNLVERPDEEFLAHQLGGNAEDFVVVRSRVRKIEADQAGEDAWDTICKLAQNELEHHRHYDEICKYLDVESLIDYCLVYLYAGGEDWPLNRHNNMKSFCQRGQVSPMKFLVWDADNTFASGWVNDDCDYVLSIKSRNNPKSFETVFNALSKNESFRQLFEARLAKWSTEGGPLNDVVCRDRYQSLLNSIEPALIAESARWGDVQSDAPYLPTGGWENQKNRILDEWFVNRTDRLLTRMQQYWVECENRTDD
ncbi:CotH kinase family protein [Mariniblastus sp.]|nr:CotH kinase family protein [Mariniblastus sp.]